MDLQAHRLVPQTARRGQSVLRITSSSLLPLGAEEADRHAHHLRPHRPAVSEPTVQLLLTTVDALRDLLGALIDLQPPDTQKALADLQADLYQAVADFHAQQEGE